MEILFIFPGMGLFAKPHFKQVTSIYMKRFLLLLLFLFSFRSQAQDILYFLPDSVEVNLYNQIQGNKRIVLNSVFIFLEKINNIYTVKLGKYDKGCHHKNIINLILNCNRKAVINQYRIPIIFDTDIAFCLNQNTDWDFVYTLSFLSNGVIIHNQSIVDNNSG